MRRLQVLLLVLVPVFAMAAAPATEIAAPNQVQLPFAPPTAPVHYQSSFLHTSRSGTTTINSTEEVTFRRSAKGFDSVWTTRSVTVDAPPPLGAILTKIMSAAAGVPLKLELTPQGEPERIANVAEIRAASDRSLDGVPRAIDEMTADAPAEVQAMVRNITEQLIAQQRAQTVDAYEAEVLEVVSLLLGWSAMTLVPGKPVTATVENGPAVEGNPMTFHVTIELTAFEPGKSATIKIATVSDPVDVRAEVAGEVENTLSAAAAGNSQTRAELQATAKKALDQLGAVSVSEEKIAVIDLPSGLPSRATYRKRVTIAGGPTEEERREYRRID